MDRLTMIFQLQKHDFHLSQYLSCKIYWQIHIKLDKMVFFSMNKI